MTHSSESERAKWREENKRRRERDPEKVKADKKKSSLKMRRDFPELVKERQRARRHKNAERDWFKRLLNCARDKSKQRGHGPAQITRDDLEAMWDRQKGRCHWTSIEMSRSFHDLCSASIDRIDHSSGYRVDNIVLSTWGANRARNNASVEEFSQFIASVRSCSHRVDQARKAGIPVRTIPRPE